VGCVGLMIRRRCRRRRRRVVSFVWKELAGGLTAAEGAWKIMSSRILRWSTASLWRKRGISDYGDAARVHNRDSISKKKGWTYCQSSEVGLIDGFSPLLL